MPSSKRKTRRRDAEVPSDDVVDSSPSKPSSKKRKTQGTRTSPLRRATTPEENRAPLDEDNEDSGEEDSEAAANNDLIESVISYLQVAKEPVNAQTQYANDKDVNVEKVNAYAKIAGKEWTYFVVEQNVNIGRPPDNKDTGSGSGLVSSPAADLRDTFQVQIDLGPNKVVSRHHASVFYDSDYPEGGGWHVRVNGRNGVRLNTIFLKRGQAKQLKCGDVMEISGTQMMFVTPGEKAIIDPIFIERAKQMAAGDEQEIMPHAHPGMMSKPLLPSGGLYPTTGSQMPLAPAPPYFKRATTPPVKAKTDSNLKQSPMYNRGMMMESTQEIDYSKDSAKDLKPPFSYATMIAQAIFSSDEEKLTLSNIYSWIQDRYAFYRHSNTGWQNSIRHNLSLNKAFQKVPRRTDEPGKGMKWQIAPEHRSEYLKKQGRKGTGSSSAPTSPAAAVAPGREAINPNFRGANGQNIGYDSSYVSSFSAKANSGSPAYNMSSQHPHEAFTPERGNGVTRRRGDTITTAPEPDLDDSPLPPNGRPQQQPAYGLSAAAAQSPPALSSSYLDTPFASQQMITPAPRRQNVRLAPPSTLVAPSKFMPDSSPAAPGTGLFWKGLMGSTPAGPRLPEISPLKRDNDTTDDGAMPSSSPPPMIGETGSPTKRSVPPPARRSPLLMQNGERSVNRTNGPAAADEDEGEAVGGFDLARGFQPIGSMHSHPTPNAHPTAAK